jgi:hypothetical protein
MLPALLIGAGAAALAALLGGSRKQPGEYQPVELGFSKRDQVARAAASQVGLSDPRPYIEDALGESTTDDFEWCGMFALWAIHQAGLLPGVLWKIGEGFASEYLKQIPASELAAGDVVYWDQPYQHHAVVEWVDHARGLMSTINGNGAGGAVTRVVRSIAGADGYYSLKELPGVETPLRRAA